MAGLMKFLIKETFKACRSKPQRKKDSFPTRCIKKAAKQGFKTFRDW